MKLKGLKYKYHNVLLIDDNEMDNFINEKMLEATHFSKHVNISTNGESAIGFINRIITSPGTDNHAYPDLIFVDLNMPVMDGFDFIEKFMEIKDEKLSECRIVILTSSIDHEDRLKAEKLGSHIIFKNKPLSIEFLANL